MKKVPNAECDMPTTRVFYKPDISSWCKSGDISINLMNLFLCEVSLFWKRLSFGLFISLW